eukprot:Nitzschia sp. Nitz4//scaffold181_size46380//7284//8743//NITZ4_007170-RA/size46380-augustus-gene-0.39-mRNA-1//1//CDS//3329539489//4902//frame0
MNNNQLLEALLSSLNRGRGTVATSIPAYNQSAPQPSSFLPSNSATVSNVSAQSAQLLGGAPSPASNNTAAALQTLLASMTPQQAGSMLPSLDSGTQALVLKALLEQCIPQQQQRGHPPPVAGGGENLAHRTGTPSEASRPAIVAPPAVSTTNKTTRIGNGKDIIKNAQQLIAEHLGRQSKFSSSGTATTNSGTGTTGSTSTTAPPTNPLPAKRDFAAATAPPPAFVTSAPSVVSTTSSRKSTLAPSTASTDTTGVREEKKRAANRISAQRCRRRKREYFEELKEENDELRKLNHLLEVVPDLIVSFDASGIMRFVSKSSTEFLGESSENLVGTSFWRLLCSNSARRLKSIFMDSMAKRNDESNKSVPLGDRWSTWNIRLKGQDEDLSGPSLNLRGTLYFTDGAPQCVCTIRQTEEGSGTQSLSAKHLLWRDDRQPSEESFVSGSEDSKVPFSQQS